MGDEAMREIPLNFDDLMRRAMAAYFRGYAPGMLEFPSESLSGVEEIDDKAYAVLRNGHRTLAVYRVKPDGLLRRLRRWPKDLGEA